MRAAKEAVNLLPYLPSKPFPYSQSQAKSHRVVSEWLVSKSMEFAACNLAPVLEEITVVQVEPLFI